LEKSRRIARCFLKEYPDASSNVFLPFALYDRANCHYAEEEYDEALTAIARIIDEFPESNVTDQAYNLRGNVEQALGNNDNAEQAYIKALEISETRRNYMTSSEAIYSLIALLGQHTPGKEPSPRLKDAVPYADRFWKEFAENSPYQSRAAVAQLHALVSVGRGDEALERLQKVIAEFAKNPEATGLEELVNSYTEAYLTNHTPEQLKDHYYDFPDIRAQDHAARALLRVAIIGVFEEIVKKSDDENVKNSGTARIKILFQELKRDFSLKDLTNFILVKIGDYLRTNTASPREALPYYDEALNRPDQSYRFNALLGRADVNGKSQNAADIDKAIEDFTRVYNDSQDKPQREFSLYRIVELLMAKKEYEKAASQALIYLDREKTGFTKFSPDVGLLLARSFDERGMVEDAIAMYGKIWAGPHKGNIKISAPACDRWMDLLWNRNKPSSDPNVPSDRQGAYQNGAQYIEQTGRFKDKMTESDLELWKVVEARVKTYEANPAIKSLETIRREKAAASKKR
jgi:tetratricopeptide (TPR) repeat protein